MEKPSLADIDTFLRSANAHTYAVDGEKSPSTRLRSEDFEYQDGDWLYHNTYFGGADFIGNETVHFHERPVWGMNYHGFIMDKGAPVDEVYDFLKQALRVDDDTLPSVRGPRSFVVDEWEYRCTIDGDLGRFSGWEEIMHQRQVVYHCFLHGGCIG